MHILSRHMIGPVFVLNMAFVRQAVEHAGCQQCIHCRFTKTVFFPTMYLFTTVRCIVLVYLSLFSALSLAISGTGKLFTSAQACSQVRHPEHRVISVRTPTNCRGLVFSSPYTFLDKRERPAAPRVLRKLFRFTCCTPSGQIFHMFPNPEQIVLFWNGGGSWLIIRNQLFPRPAVTEFTVLVSLRPHTEIMAFKAGRMNHAAGGYRSVSRIDGESLMTYRTTVNFPRIFRVLMT